MEGKGTFILANGAKYTGDFVNNKFHGIGVFTCPGPGGAQYADRFVNGIPKESVITCPGGMTTKQQATFR